VKPFSERIRRVSVIPPFAFETFTVLVITVGTLPSIAETRTFRTVPNDDKNIVQFVSNATLERIIGRTSAISGSIDLNLEDVSAATKGNFEVDLRTVDTGIAMRNQDMRTNYLETDRFPTAKFRLTKIVSAEAKELLPGQTVNIVAEGEFTVHGTGKVYQVPITLTYLPASSDPQTSERLPGGGGDLISVTAEWSLKLADHGIMRPSFLFMRLAEEQVISVAFVLTDKIPAR
jgi:polyisoprenoid-binding protein YceI